MTFIEFNLQCSYYISNSSMLREQPQGAAANNYITDTVTSNNNFT